jgi:hypothetical protein
LVSSNGDIDNRIKVLLDGLQMPKDPSQLGGLAIDSTDRPESPYEAIADVHLVIHVQVENPSAIFAGGRLV